MQYDSTIDQLKKIREEIESYINDSEDFNQSTGVAVRIEKFSDSSIDLLVRCFTNSNSWSNSLEVKERLAIEIKQIVEKNNASFALSIDPKNRDLIKRSEQITLARSNGLFTVPSELGLEKKTNPFLRPFDKKIRENLNMHRSTDVEVFSKIRTLKDNF